MLKGFKEFILRGNVVDLAIAVVIGTAFAAVVSAFVSKIVTPVINALPGGSSSGLGFSLRHGAKFTSKTGTNTTFVDISGIINAIVVFVITEMADRAGSAGVLSPMFAACGPAFVAIVIGLTMLLYKEDGWA